MKLTFRINFLSDYHIGAGHGKGMIDSVILKNKQGLPTVRGTTLSGLLRQGIWDLLKLDLLESYRKCKRSDKTSGISYCSFENKRSICPICRILGTPAHQKNWRISSAEIEDSAIKNEVIVWRNKVNQKTRTAEARKLFNEEAIGRGVSFVFTVSNESNGAQVLEEASFIVAAFRMIRNLGSSRRRGKGSCQFHLIEITDVTPDLKNFRDITLENHFLDIFKSVWLEYKELGLYDPAINPKTVKESNSANKTFNVVLLTEEPLLIANKSESGNIYDTIRHIPGYSLLGALAWKFARQCDLDDKDIYVKFIRTFRRGEVKVSPLYPARKIKNYIYPSIPSPQDFLSCKLYPTVEKFGHGVNGYATDISEPEKCEICSSKNIETPLETLNKYIAIKKFREHVETAEVNLREEMHITIDPDKGKAKKGDLFGYVSIDSGEYFIGTIEIADWTNFINFMEIDSKNPIFELLIGKASSRGHGRVKVWLQPDIGSENIFLGTELKERITDLTEPLRMTLITDTILVDNWGRFLNNLNEEYLSDLLDVEVETVLNAYVKSKNVDGFNTHLGLPKWRDIAITAGSTIGLKMTYPYDEEKLLNHLIKLEREGIGLRKDEGFGRIAFNHPIYNNNKDVDVGIHLPEHMRIKEKGKSNVEAFMKLWDEYLKKQLSQIDFTDQRWRGVSRWLRSNSREGIEEIGQFQTPEEPLSDLINQRKALPVKETFLEKKAREKIVLNSVLNDLSERLEYEDDGIQKYLQMKAIEMLADCIASGIKEDQR